VWVAGITTGLDTTEEEGRDRPMQKAKMEIILTKSPQFDELMAASTSQQPGNSSGPQAPGASPPGRGPSSQPQVTLHHLMERLQPSKESVPGVYDARMPEGCTTDVLDETILIR
jgi:hypothetical protein